MTDPAEEFDVPVGDSEPPEEELGPTFSVDKRKYFELIKYKPHGRQWLYHESKSRFKIPVAGRRFGKSLMTGKDVEPLLMVPNKRVWIIGPTYDLGEKEFRVIWDDMIVRLAFGREPLVKKAYSKKQGNMFIEFPWNTRIEVRSAERPDTLVGEALDYAIMSEAAKHGQETWDRYVRPALSDKRGGATFGTTPEGMNWLYNMWQLGQNPEFPDYASWRYPSWENLHVYPGGRQDPEIVLLERTMPKDWFDQEIAALFTAFVGKIYDEWQEETHVRTVKYNPAWPNYMCVDEETEILTSTGWKRHTELSIGDEVLSINPETGLSEWDEVLTVNKYDGEHQVVRMEGRSHSSVTTLNHRWLTNRSYQRGKKTGRLGWRWTTTDKLTQDDRIPTAAPCVNLPTEAKYTDAFVELVAWLWTEGSLSNETSFTIHQSHKVNQPNVDRIRAALFKTFGDTGWSERVSPSLPNITNFYLHREASKYLWQAFHAHKYVRHSFIRELTEAQLNLFVDVSVMADGYVNKTTRIVSQKNSEQLWPLQMACTLLGLTTNITHSSDHAGYTLHISTRSFINPGMARRHNGRFVYQQEMYNGIVWCPMTKNGTWLARRRGTVYFTGNCFDWGFVNPLAAIEFQVDPWGRVYVWREHYKERMILRDHLIFLKNRPQPEGYKIDLCFGDAADPEAIAQVCADFGPCWGDPKSKDIWLDGVQLVKQFLQLQQVGEADEYGTPLEEPWLFVDHSCVNLIREFNNYRSAPPTSGKTDKNLREMAQAWDDHALDALRYGMMHVFRLGANVRLSSIYSADDFKQVDGNAGFFTSGVKFS